MNNTKPENILLPWADHSHYIKSMSCDMPCPCPDCGAPPMLATAQDAVPVPRATSPVSVTPQQAWSQLPSVLPSQVQTLACLHPQEGACCPKMGLSQCPQLPAPCWGSRTGPGCRALSQQTPMGSPLILQGLALADSRESYWAVFL